MIKLGWIQWSPFNRKWISVKKYCLIKFMHVVLCIHSPDFKAEGDALVCTSRAKRAILFRIDPLSIGAQRTVLELTIFFIGNRRIQFLRIWYDRRIRFSDSKTGVRQARVNFQLIEFNAELFEFQYRFIFLNDTPVLESGDRIIWFSIQFFL